MPSGKPLSFAPRKEAEPHPASHPADENAVIVPDHMVNNQRENEQLHIIPYQDNDGNFGIRIATYVNGGAWGGKIYHGYVKKQAAPRLTLDGSEFVAEQMLSLTEQMCNL